MLHSLHGAVELLRRILSRHDPPHSRKSRTTPVYFRLKKYEVYILQTTLNNLVYTFAASVFNGLDLLPHIGGGVNIDRSKLS